jgi:hypothetical protein
MTFASCDVHLHQRPLHVLHMPGLGLEQHLAQLHAVL